MKFMHLGDLHLGKRVNEVNMLEDQWEILKRILAIAKEQQIDACLIAGDVFDKAVPCAEAVQLFDFFITQLSQMQVEVFLISGNHDSAQRLSFASGLLASSGVHIGTQYGGNIKQVTVKDQWGEVQIYLLPFIKPAHVRNQFPDVEIQNTNEAIRLILEKAQVDSTQRTVLLAHQFVTSFGQQPECCESEINPIGGLDSVDVALFDAFDYVALGHLHGAQKMGRETVRYSGSPLKYSFSEVLHKKSAVIVTMEEKGKIEIEKIPLVPVRDMRTLKGTLENLLNTAQAEGGSEDYILAILTDEQPLLDPLAQLRIYYPNIMKLEFSNRRSIIEENSETAASEVENKTPLELFEEFYLLQNNVPLSCEQEVFMQSIFEGEMKL